MMTCYDCQKQNETGTMIGDRFRCHPCQNYYEDYEDRVVFRDLHETEAALAELEGVTSMYCDLCGNLLTPFEEEEYGNVCDKCMADFEEDED